MKFIHTADWHLGLSFYKRSLIDDQAYVLDQLIDLTREAQPHVLIVSGDIYDRPVPPVEAVRLLDDVLCRLILDLKVPVILIGGNHDSPLRLEFAARLLETHRLRVYSSLSDRLQAIDMFENGVRVTFFPLPYAEPAQTREFFNVPGLVSHEDALRQWLAFIKSKQLAGSRSVLIHHTFVGGGEISDSERPLDVGGSEAVSLGCFDDFDYVALGHLHRSQSLGKNNHIHYSGSLLKYSFSESGHTKGVKLVEINPSGKCKVESIPLLPKHDVRCVEGTMQDLLLDNIDKGNTDDYIQVRLLDSNPVFDAMDRLREVFPNLVTIDPTNFAPLSNNLNRVDHRKKELTELFRDFYTSVTGEDLTQGQISAFSEIVNHMRESERLT